MLSPFKNTFLGRFAELSYMICVKIGSAEVNLVLYRVSAGVNTILIALTNDPKVLE